MAFDEQFYREVCNKRAEFEQMSEEQQIEYSNVTYDNSMMNNELSHDEVSKAIDRTKCKKAYLEIPNDVMKNQNAKTLIHRFLNLCFIAGLNPTDWYFSNIKPT